MVEDLRMRIHELEARYELEPGLKDVFVEGAFDKELLTEGCSTGVNQGRVYYEIDAVDVPNEVVTALGLTLGNKQRVIALAKALEGLDEECEYRCLVDRDLDGWIGGITHVARLKWTRFTSVEAYFIRSDVVKRYLITVAKSRIEDWGRFYTSFVRVLRDLFAMRLADRDLGLNLTWVKVDKSLKMAGGVVRFDLDGYVKKILQGSGAARQLGAFTSAMEQWVERLDEDDRNCVRGHDFTYLMSWVIGSCGGIKGYGSEEALSRLLVITTSEAPELIDIVA
ncbi:hypothetical protein N800_11140 [Lysobacter daejeonensis GH1-9]|uniref:DUF4435 domain-containing protein n=1 Tax=Lysobacter daejeonensis GH1-9 TaxID=1385517 RepID=A0A0A0EQ28_9GAMM|nr:hypothetical protein [Lysobacter daejeonensis]KGM53096.1 hypothetical protein N800_11140 [Lysobacter daejeonensis GH1-9]